MKKILLILFLIISYSLLTLNFVKADYSTSLQNFNTAYENYRAVYQDFIKARNSYLKYNTLNAQNEAIAKTRLFLEERDEVLTSYFSLLKEKLTIAEGIIPFEKNLKFVLLDTRLQQIEKHKESLPAVASLNDYVAKSKELEKDQNKMIVEGGQTRGNILVGKIQHEANQFSQTIAKITDIVNQIKTEGKNVEKLERWILETNYKFELAQKKLTESKNAFENLNPDYDGQSQQNYLKARLLAIEGNQYLKEAVSNTKEAIKEIQSGPY